MLVRAALICVACDIPAARKVCGFVALKACSKCLKSFSTQNFGEKADFSGFDRNHTGVVQKNTLLLRHKQQSNGSMVVGTVAYLSCHISILLLCVSLTQCITFFWVRIWKERELIKQNQFKGFLCSTWKDTI